MELKFTPEEEAFRQEVRDFIDANLPDATRQHLKLGNAPTKEMTIEWQRTLNKKGWATPRWPAEWGGPGWTVTQQYIFQQENQRAPAPDPLGFGVNMVGPVIIQFGNEEQKKRFLPRIANIDDWWCQGFSEPGAGSDLASLKTRAEKDGDHWIVNGQKTWTTLAQHADWIFALVRTSNEGKKQEGISFLLIDMKSPGVEVHPIQTMDGGHEINSVFFTDVKVPAENMIGEVNKGWTYAKFLLGNERLGAPRVGASQAKLQELKEIAKNRIVRGRPLWDHPRFRDKFVEAQIELKALEMTVMRVLSGIESGADQSKPDPATSVIKIKGAQMVQRLTELYVEAAGEQSVPWLDDEGDNAQVGPDWTIRAAPNYFNMRKSSIYGGSDQVQKGIISKAILGL
ncbi:acyl-CoA dehydrogenase family protein [Pseudooceanicola nanhaiensis]|jgi:alkylation response protein AidB-like acyl-CoA dehydrogenase|uniref:Pimeloyl-CoA dehydrogenase large subunit n=1 Tax=Pseudooceanicola nanhaiensis TaxID=375761 RepID=A0A917SMR2_9RHOB|nr:acyl-CoA dehydrogenase family protein [Pseudooceanicola nanhaiensis]GGL86987.1 pimeloyl-CoA dehydrogenase large subunit [Pseudooceanicola nanhaiensis]